MQKVFLIGLKRDKRIKIQNNIFFVIVVFVCFWNV